MRPASACRHGSEADTPERPAHGDLIRGRRSRRSAPHAVGASPWRVSADSRRHAFCEGHQELPLVRLGAGDGWPWQSMSMVARLARCMHDGIVHASLGACMSLQSWLGCRECASMQARRTAFAAEQATMTQLSLRVRRSVRRNAWHARLRPPELHVDLATAARTGGRTICCTI